jgi:tetratricopeptide (TPR) repeat protein
MFDLSAIKNAQAKANVNRAEKLDEYDDLIKEAFAFFEKAIQNSDSDGLRRAAGKYIKAISFRRDKVEPFSYLATIFYLFDQEETCMEFYEKAKALDPTFSEIKKLERMLFKS